MSADFFWLTSPCKGNSLLTARLHLRAPSNVNLVKVNLQYFDISVSFQPTIEVHSFHGGHGHGYGYDMDMAMDMIKVLRPSNMILISTIETSLYDMDCYRQIELNYENWKVLILTLQ